MKTLTACFFTLLALASPVYSGTGAAILRTPLSVQQAGIGGIGIAGGDALAAWKNPAIVAEQDSDFAISAGGGSLLSGKNQMLLIGGGLKPTAAWGLGAMLFFSGRSIREVNEWGNNTSSEITQSTIAGGLTLGLNVLKWAGTGLTIKLIRDDVAGDTVTAVGFDLGARSEIPVLRESGNSTSSNMIIVSATIRNLGTGLRPATSNIPADVLPVEATAGLGFARKGLLGAAEYIAEHDRDSRICIGSSFAPFFPSKLFTLRLGIDGLRNFQQQLCAGFTVGYRNLVLDYAFQTNPVGDNHRIALTISFDKPKVASAASYETPAEVANIPEYRR